MKNIGLTFIRNYGKMIAAVALVALMVTGCNDDFTSPASPTGSNVGAVVSSASNLTILNAALAKTNQGPSLSNNNSGTFTLFAPSDSAFLVYFQGKLGKPAFTVDSVLNYITVKMTTTSTVSISALSLVLTYHVISSALPKAALTGTQTFATLNGARLSISLQGSQVLLNANTTGNGAKVETFDAQASNGVVHTINRVLVPVSTASAASLLGISVNYSTTPATISVGATSGNNYDVLAAAIKKAGLTVASAILPNTSPLPEVTVFAPTDAAFIAYYNVGNEAAAIAAVNALDANGVTALTALLEYHIIAGKRVLTTDLTDGEAVATLNGATFAVHIGPPVKLTDNSTDSADATITSPNNLTNAGVVHGIDVVMRP